MKAVWFLLNINVESSHMSDDKRVSKVQPGYCCTLLIVRLFRKCFYTL